jgi:hypothetical protein
MCMFSDGCELESENCCNGCRTWVYPSLFYTDKSG